MMKFKKYAVCIAIIILCILYTPIVLIMYSMAFLTTCFLGIDPTRVQSFLLWLIYPVTRLVNYLEKDLTK